MLDELNSGIDENVKDEATIVAWQKRCDELSVDLLFSLSSALGYRFNKVELKRGIYHPRGHVAKELGRTSYMKILRNYS